MEGKVREEILADAKEGYKNSKYGAMIMTQAKEESNSDYDRRIAKERSRLLQVVYCNISELAAENDAFWPPDMKMKELEVLESNIIRLLKSRWYPHYQKLEEAEVTSGKRKKN